MNTKLLTIILILNIFSKVGFTQNNNFAPIGSRWYYNLQSNSNNIYDSIIIYESSKDTIISNKICKEIKNTTDQNKSYYMYSENQKVYLWMYNQWHIIYNFEANSNDTIQLYHLYPKWSQTNGIYDTIYNFTLVIDSIGYINLDSSTQKIIYSHYINSSLTSGWSCTYIEKIGSLGFLIPRILPTLIPEDPLNSIFLRCYHDSVIHFISPYWNSINLPCDYNNISKNAINNIKIFPNPISTKYLYINITTVKKTTLKVNNIFGFEINNFILENGENIIDVSNFPSGILIIEIIIGNEFYYNKIIKL